MVDFKPDRDIGDLTGKVIVITGGTAGLGRETINKLIVHGSPRIIFTGRNSKAAEETIQSAAAVNPQSDVSFVKCDMSDLADMKKAASKISTMIDRVDLIFCNAGIMATPPGLSKDGFENQFATNHLGHAMLVKSLLPILERTANLPGADVRVVFTTSLGYKFANKINYNSIRTTQDSMILGPWRRYGQSKLANILYPTALAYKYPFITFASIHPGVIRSGLVSSLPLHHRLFTDVTTFAIQVPVEEGVRNQLWAATAPKEGVLSGRMYEPVGKLSNVSAAAKDEGMAEKLYTWTEEVLANF